MKKHIVAIVLIAGLTMASAASANWGRGGHGNGGDGNCPQMGSPMMQGQMMQQLDPATKEKVSKFFKENPFRDGIFWRYPEDKKGKAYAKTTNIAG